jgi:GDP-L-fucose synthase
MTLDPAVYAQQTQPMLSHINIGTGVDCTISELAHTMARVTGFTGTIAFDSSKPDGTPRKLMDVSRLERLGWTAKIALEDGLRSTYQWFLQHDNALRSQ